jgi:tRNA threonylcarbamoyladenosine biosynthesis protein TsaE
MNTAVTLRIESTSSTDTEQIAEQIGKHLKGGEVIELASDLGGGKTTFVRGLARGAGSEDRVASPTFTISKVYKTPAVEIQHFDFYRLQDAGLTANELHDVVGDQAVVVVVEWGGLVRQVLPEERLSIHIHRTADDNRTLTLTCPDSLQYLLQDYVDTDN